MRIPANFGLMSLQVSCTFLYTKYMFWIVCSAAPDTVKVTLYLKTFNHQWKNVSTHLGGFAWSLAKGHNAGLRVHTLPPTEATTYVLQLNWRKCMQCLPSCPRRCHRLRVHLHHLLSHRHPLHFHHPLTRRLPPSLCLLLSCLPLLLTHMALTRTLCWETTKSRK